MKWRLGIFCPGAGTGGPWRYVHSILAGIDPSEFDVTVFCDLHGIYEPRPWAKVVGLKGGYSTSLDSQSNAESISTASRKENLLRTIVPAPMKLCAGFAREVRRLAKMFRQYPIDILHTQNTGCEESAVAATLAGVPKVIGTFHVDSTYDLQRERSEASHRILEMLSNRCLDTAIAVSHATKRDWLKRTHLSAERVVNIYNGIDAAKFRRQISRGVARAKLGLPADALIVGGLGRLDEAKGFVYLIEATAKLRTEFKQLLVAIAGDGLLRAELEGAAARLGVSDRIRFLGFQADVQCVLDSLDIFALPSLCEALPYALLEAMATELPAVGTTVGGVPEVIVEGMTGFLIPPRNPEQFAASLRRLLSDAGLRKRMGIIGRERVVNVFREDEMVMKTIELYRGIPRHQLAS
jgi:glycosyltransferase involved in cell wall biosynthesis